MRKTILLAACFAWCAIASSQPLRSIERALPLPHAQRPHTKPVAPGAPQPGTVFDATRLGGPLVLDKGWRVGISAEPTAASPDFDDSTWAIRDAAPSIQEVQELQSAQQSAQQAAQRPDQARGPGAGPGGGGGKPNGGAGSAPGQRTTRPYTWFRMHIDLPANHGPVALMIEVPVSRSTALSIGEGGTYTEVYANGNQIRPEGPNGSDPGHYQQISRVYNLNIAPEQTSLLLAVRIPYSSFGYNAYTNFFESRSLLLGKPEDLERSLTTWNDGTIFERIPRLVYSVTLVILAIFLFALYFAQRGHNEYLWLALHELLQAPMGFVEFAGSTARLDNLWYAALYLQLMVVSAYLFYEFLVSFLDIKRRWYTQTLRYSAPVLAGVGPTLLLVGHSTAIGIALVLVFTIGSLWILGYLIFVFATLIAATFRRNFEAGLLLIPLVLSIVGNLEPTVTSGLSEFANLPTRAPLTFLLGPIPIHMAAIADYTGVLAIVIIIFMRFLRIQQSQQHASSEMAAARSVQELMLPLEKVATPGFEVNSVYCPAAEVGGDFFHVQTTEQGGVLVVIGDVAGKGLKAAMTVSMIMGALRRTTDLSPARILNALNRVLSESNTLTTCQAVWFGADGAVVLANAGHLPPFLNTQEITLPGALPLGVVPEVSYEEMRLFLHPGDRLLMLSDGVVEARRPTGELFGFDRVHNLSSQTAFYIADAAKEFGQNDDITVLTVRRLAQPA